MPLPVEWEKEIHDISLKEDYSAVNVRALIFREYINRSDNGHINRTFTMINIL